MDSTIAQNRRPPSAKGRKFQPIPTLASLHERLEIYRVVFRPGYGVDLTKYRRQFANAQARQVSREVTISRDLDVIGECE